MLFLRLSSPNIRTQLTLPCQWLSVTINTVRLKSKSSLSDSDSDSDSSSDSDRDDQRKNQQINVGNSKELNSSESTKADPFINLIDDLLSRSSPKPMDIGITVRNREKKIENQLVKIADKLTTTVGGNKEQIMSTLLSNLSTMEKHTEKKKLPKITESVWSTLKRENWRMAGKKKHDIRQRPIYDNRNMKPEQRKFEQRNNKIPTRVIIEQRYGLGRETRFENIRKVEEAKEIEKLPKIDKTMVVDTTQRPVAKDSVISELLTSHQQMLQSNSHQQAKMVGIHFDKTQVSDSNVPELKTWDACEAKEIEILNIKYPENAFQEMIQWTEEGKLWKFPINNEQGMEKEQNVHFSEHVFLERHLTGWCPIKGPLRHFMELVCVGLSKNPYMTVEEKHEHIMWYKDYFDEKKDLLNQLGLVGTVVTDGEKLTDNEPQ